jgi:hypothetical protein
LSDVKTIKQSGNSSFSKSGLCWLFYDISLNCL